MRRVATSCIVLLLVPLLALAAQGLSSRDIGRKVRLKTDSMPEWSEWSNWSEWIAGIVVAADRDSLRLRQADGTVVRIALRRVTRIEMVVGTRANTAKGALVGFVTGALTGAAAGLVSGSEESGPISPAFGALLAGAVGGGAGLVVGGIIGTTQRRERWVEVQLGPRPVALVPHGLGLGVSINF